MWRRLEVFTVLRRERLTADSTELRQPITGNPIRRDSLEKRSMRLVCKAHNLHLAERDFGKDWMSRYRHRFDRVREPQSTYGVPSRPDGFDLLLVSSSPYG